MKTLLILAFALSSMAYAADEEVYIYGRGAGGSQRAEYYVSARVLESLKTVVPSDKSTIPDLASVIEAAMLYAKEEYKGVKNIELDNVFMQRIWYQEKKTDKCFFLIRVNNKDTQKPLDELLVLSDGQVVKPRFVRRFER